ncbi:MAG: NADP-dependent phosphogluconate dehydrogenase [Deltaproteobacteria bacterium]|nr:NADP-dependent phosphogluconate dehydrogenase [Deltaproteobacteria bacterium]
MTGTTAHIGLVGLGVMGSSLARNFASRGLTVAVNNYENEVTTAFMAEYGDEGSFVACSNYAALAAALAPPRRVLLMVTAGKPVDLVLRALTEVLEPGDMVVDGGNSHFPDTDRRVAEAAASGIHFVGMGVSGGEEGALKGPSMMPGGTRASWEALKPLLEAAAAVSDSGPCVTWCGHGSAGHYTKMVHNGIEYGDMQLIAETWTLLRALGHGPAAIRDVFTGWNEGVLGSFLIEITARIAGAKDPQGDGPLVEQILDVAGQKGTGRWTAIDAIMRGIPLSTVVAAVDARALSARKEDRLTAAAAFGEELGAIEGIAADDLEAALYAAKLMSYTQGFDLLRTASRERGYETDLAEVARIWTAGCIIRATFLDRVHAAYAADPDLPLLCLDPGFAADLTARLPAWRRVVAAAVSAGIPVPALSASLAWFDSIRLAEGSARVIQAQRDLFGAHTFRRTDAPETPVHVQWSELEQL